MISNLWHKVFRAHLQSPFASSKFHCRLLDNFSRGTVSSDSARHTPVFRAQAERADPNERESAETGSDFFAIAESRFVVVSQFRNLKTP